MINQAPVLVIDDDDDIRDMVFLVLTEEGYPVQTVEHGAAALERIGKQRYGLILCDLQMPVMDGRAFAAAYWANFRYHAPLVVMSAEQEAAGWAKQSRADAFIAKPIDFDQLIDTVHRLAPQP